MSHNLFKFKLILLVGFTLKPILLKISFSSSNLILSIDWIVVLSLDDTLELPIEHLKLPMSGPRRIPQVQLGLKITGPP